jgi:phenylacetaldehyde dehydrogenase
VLNGKYDNILLSAKFILLDTFHDGTFEKQFYKYLESIGYSGYLLLDDIHLNIEMEKFWGSIIRKKDDLTHIGPVATRQRQKSLVDQRKQLVSLGAQVFHEHEAPLEGSFFPATIMRANGARQDREIFGPLLLVEQVGSDHEALVAASTGNVGLAAYVFSEDIEVANRLAEHLPAGEIKINGTSVLDLAPNSEQSFFGNSGLGGHGDNRLLEFFTGTRVIGEDRPHLPL